MAGSRMLFPDEESNVLFTATYLRGKAFAWIEPKLVKCTPDPILLDFDLFCQDMVRSLGDPDQEKNMARTLNALKQTSSAANCRTEFDQISQYLSWDNAALRSRYYEGLKTKVKDSLALVVQEPEGFKDFHDLSVRLDTRIHDRENEARCGERTAPPIVHRFGGHRRSKTSTTTTQSFRTGLTPMDLDATRNKVFKPLTPTERQHRIINNLSLYCG